MCTQPSESSNVGQETTSFAESLMPVQQIFLRIWPTTRSRACCSLFLRVLTQERNVGFLSSSRRPSPVDIKTCHSMVFAIQASIIGNMTSATISRKATRHAAPVQRLTSKPQGLLRKSRSTCSSPFCFRVRESDLIHVALKVAFKNCHPWRPPCLSRMFHFSGHVPSSSITLSIFCLEMVLSRSGLVGHHLLTMSTPPMVMCL